MKILFTLLTSALMLTSSQLLANSTPKAEPILYIATDERPSRVISYLLGLFGKDLVSSDLPNTPVSGRFKVGSVDDVMNYFAGAYQMNWFQNGSSVYLYRAKDWKTRKIHVGEFPALTEWEELLKNSGLYYKQFNVVYSEKHHELIASGPTSYLRLLESAFGRERPEPGLGDPELMVFNLMHASVEDREINLRDKTFVSKGALTVLLELLGLKNHSAMDGRLPTPETKSNEMAGLQNPMSPSQSISSIENQTSTRRAPIPSAKNTQEAKLSPFSVTADPRTNSIVIRDAKSKYDYYRKLIEKLDSPIAMVEVEAMLVEVDKGTLDQLGVEFGLRAGGVQFDFPGLTPPVGTSLFSGTSSVVDPARFLARIRALIADQNAKVLARPNIVTQDNIPAFIDLSETQYLRVTGERVAQIVPITAGSLLQVTPRLVRRDSGEEIFLRVDIEDGSLSQGGDGGMPLVRNTVLSTQAVVNVDKALLIGGYNRDSENTTKYKVPLLGDLPFIGKAFSYADKQTQTMVRLFLITPRVIELPPDGRSSTRKAGDYIKENFKLENDENLKMTPSINLGRFPSSSLSMRK